MVLPVSESVSLPSKYGLRHRAGMGISEKTDALVIVISEQRGVISYIKGTEIQSIKDANQLKKVLAEDLSF